jgi:hypothetical protein
MLIIILQIKLRLSREMQLRNFLRMRSIFKNTIGQEYWELRNVVERLIILGSQISENDVKLFASK